MQAFFWFTGDVPTITRLLLVLSLVLTGCGYHLQTSKSELVERYQVRKVYIKGVINNSLRPGLENVVYNALVKGVAAHGGISIVNRIEEADAVLEGAISSMSSSPNASTSYSALSAGSSEIQDFYKQNSYTTEYVASLSCAFSLLRNYRTREGSKLRDPTIWAGSFSRSKPYPGFLQIGVPGSTSHLIADTELDRTLAELASQMMGDLRESMLAMF